ncbi:zinc finger protein 462 isoform X3 [Sphaerodactylus townsendi]|uniref:zinc finger protein 462 isoform X3 n=1 Tax=Sphaerodactylus townsendi TaxID=933632 RepID=UPI002027219F|nr:zinc finger protein 462 isoform X3 [Sphaerodactylus townsendi]
MEVLQCDGCDFRAPSYEDLKAHIQDVHTAFLQPTDVSEESPSQSRFSSMNSGDQTEVEYSSVKDEFAITDEMAGQNAAQLGTGNYYSHSQSYYSQHMLSKPASKFFQCKFCVRYFRSKILLIEHTRKVHGAQAGGGSPTGSPGAGSLNYNIMMHEGFGKVFSCQFCTYKSPRRARIIKHQKMYHKNSLKESSASPAAAAAAATTAAISESASTSGPGQDSCKELPAEVVERSILESMVKPLTKSRGNFCCEWCSYQTPRRERWCDHMMKKHRSMVKILSSLRQQDGNSMQELSSKGPPSPTQNSNYIPMNASGREMPNANVSNFRGSMNNSLVRSNSSTSSKFSSVSYPHMKHKAPHNSGIVSMSDRSRYGIADMTNSSADMDTNSMLNDSSSDDELNELDSENGLNSIDHQASGLTAEQLMGSEGHKLLETKGIPFRRFMNRFQCPFCPFLTMHRRSISRHIENIHLSGKTAVYKCDECPFTCKSSFKLGAHKQCHTGAASDWDAVNSQTESIASSLNESTVSYEGGNINGRKSGGMMDSMQQQQQSPQSNSQHPYKCTMCNYSTTTLKGLRVHQQHKHSFCDNLPKYEGLSSNTPQESEPDTHASPSTVKKSQTSILGLSSKNNFVAKSSRKMSNDFPLDLSPVKKRTRIDEIASNLQSKINQNKQQEDAVINVEDDEEEEEDNEVEIEVELDKEEEQAEQLMEIASFTSQQMWGRDAVESQKDSGYRNIPQDYHSTNGAEIELTISEDEEDYYGSSVGLKDQGLNSSVLGSQSSMYGSDQNNENSDYGDSGRLYYCKHCDFSNKSARSVSTHYQRMHPYIKFSFRYILDPNDHSAVYRCLECYIDYTNFEDLQQHYGEHHPEAMNVLNFDHSDLIYRCRFCSYTSPNVRSLMPHYQRMHPTVKINNAMIFSSYVVEQQEGLAAESQTLREILNSAPKSLATSTPVARGTGMSAAFSKNSSKGDSPESDSQKESSVNSVVVYDCDVCSFASPNMHSVLVHYQKKHPEEKASYFRIQKTMRIVSVERGSALAQMAYEMGSPVSPKMSSMPSQLPPPPPPDLPTELYYCKHCSYSNRSVVGVLVHYQKRHPEIKVTAKYIRQAPPTAAMMRSGEMPPGIHRPPGSMQQLNRGNAGSSAAATENEMFFCQHCDYGNRTVKGVLIHYQKKHRDFKANADVIRQHTATIRSLCDRGQKNSPGGLRIHTLNAEREKPKLRALKCRQCSYTSPYFYALRKHIKKDHASLKATVTSILRWAFLDGLIEAGYHCEWCIYSHGEPSGLLVHYQRRHPEHYVDYTYMATKLWAGPDPSPPALLIPSEMKTYKCRDCIFEASSIWDITNHYQAFHPWAMNGDESVLLDIIKEKDAAEKANPACNDAGAGMNSEDQITALVPQVDHDAEYAEDANLPQDKAIQITSANPAISSTPYQCTVCQSEYNNLHGLLTHYGKKHPGMKVKAADFAQDVDINPGAVYKCRHCPYINTRIHGVLTHYQKRHPSVKVTAEDFVHDVEQPNDMNQNDVEETSRIFKQGYGAYRCKLCPYTHGTLEKLKIHYEKYHNQPEFDVFAQSPPKLSASVEPEVVAEIKPSPEIVPEEIIGDDSVPLPHFSSSHLVSHTVFRCQLCKYFCSTRKGIARHYRIKHNNVRAQPEGKNNLFKCALCSYTNPIRKGLAAHYQKRHDIDAYYTHCLAASRTVSDKPNKVIIPSPPKEDSPQLSEELRRAVERKKCSLCSFQSFSKKGIVSHYMKRHPGVFPKKQHASKLGGYFTAVYADEYEKQQEPPEERNDFEKPEVEAEGQEMEWLPFRCIKCFKLSFSTAELLCMHYTDHHSKDLKRDFAILGSGPRFQNPAFQCKHCDSKLHSTAELTAHLNSHNEEFQKRAKRQERRKQLLSKQKYTDGALVDFKQERPFGNLEEISKLKERKVVGYKCKFCVEVHPTLRAICNHLRKHVQYGNGSVVSAAVKGLRSHERSHLALAMFTREDKYSCQYCPFVSAFRHNLDRHMQAHHGHHKPFRCKLCPFKSSYNSRLKTHLLKAHAGEHAYKCSSCSFSTMTISQLKEHSLKMHGKALTLPRPRTVSLVTSHAQHASKNHTTAEEGEDSNDSSYSEPPDVQQQLNHYQSAALARNNNNISPPLSGTDQKAEAVLNCEFCEFSSGYIQSIRRHYRDKHGGKKLFKCKDCSFYTGFKSAFTMHVEAGHSAVPEEGPKDLRCPLCLYHTKYKRNMIDHIVLHREERVVPIEVCRSKLSKYLQGIVFRCDKCTFTCSSDESLQQHIEKHNELRPYKCQLCYYETKHTDELDAHLRDEHKVSRNFELVGRVNLDQLEQMKEKEECSSSDEEEKEEEMSPKAEERESMRFSENGPPEKRFPCEFCGRSFAEGSEWERHVLRHGMALNETKRVIAEDGQLKESMEDNVKVPLAEEMESSAEIVVDFSHQNDTAVCIVAAADKSLQENAEAESE